MGSEMCIRDSVDVEAEEVLLEDQLRDVFLSIAALEVDGFEKLIGCLLYTSDAADERSSVDLGGRRIIKKKIRKGSRGGRHLYTRAQNTGSGRL